MSLLRANEHQSFQQVYRVQKVLGLPSSLTPFGTTTTTALSASRIQLMTICSDEGFMSSELSGMFKKVESTLGKVLRQVVLGQKNSN